MTVVVKVQAIRDFWLCNDVIETGAVISVDRDTARRLVVNKAVSLQIVEKQAEPKAVQQPAEQKQETKPKAKR